MTKTLDVYLHENLVGYLIQDDGGQTLFEYSQNWLEHPFSSPLSQSLPLRRQPFMSKECRGFFAGVLPEEHKREVIARNLGISARNDYAMLDRIGGECAGAITFLPAKEQVLEGHNEYHRVGDAELADILRTLPRRPLMAGEKWGRLSLAGAQDKIAVHVSGNDISIPIGNTPSTHIIKPAIAQFKDIVFNEAVCMILTRNIGLPTANVEVRNVQGIDYLLVERYDRVKDSEGMVQRVHQEDFCQALGVVPEKKYQSEGGPSLPQCFDLLRHVSVAPVIDLQRFLDAVIVNVLIGNHDAHAKNFSLLYGENHSIRLSPLYDVLSTVCYPELSPHMAMNIGGQSVSDQLLPRHFETLAKEAGLAKPLVIKRIPVLADTVLSHLPEINDTIAPNLTTQIKERCERFITRFSA